MNSTKARSCFNRLTGLTSRGAQRGDLRSRGLPSLFSFRSPSSLRTPGICGYDGAAVNAFPDLGISIIVLLLQRFRCLQSITYPRVPNGAGGIDALGLIQGPFYRSTACNFSTRGILPVLVHPGGLEARSDLRYDAGRREVRWKGKTCSPSPTCSRRR